MHATCLRCKGSTWIFNGIDGPSLTQLIQINSSQSVTYISNIFILDLLIHIDCLASLWGTVRPFFGLVLVSAIVCNLDTSEGSVEVVCVICDSCGCWL